MGCACLHAPAATRTRDPKLRRLVLYPAELPEQEVRLSYRMPPPLASDFSPRLGTMPRKYPAVG